MVRVSHVCSTCNAHRAALVPPTAAVTIHGPRRGVPAVPRHERGSRHDLTLHGAQAASFVPATAPRQAERQQRPPMPKYLSLVGDTSSMPAMRCPAGPSTASVLTDLVRHDRSARSRLGRWPSATVPPKFLEQIMSTLPPRRHRAHDARGARRLRPRRGPVDGVGGADHPPPRRRARAGRLREPPLLRAVLLPDEATCTLRDVMLDVRDAMLEVLDNETLADLAARQTRLDRPARPPRRCPGGSSAVASPRSSSRPCRFRHGAHQTLKASHASQAHTV